jgi:signal peptidase
MTSPAVAKRTISGGSSGFDGVLRRAVSVLLWWVLPGIVMVGVGAYFAGVVVDHTDPPVLAVQGQSMYPRLVTGDLVVLEGVNPASLRKGDIIAVTVAPAFRARYDLPAHVVHRIVGIQHTRHGLIFTTKGDANPSKDIFQTPASNIVGEVRYTIPKVGYVFLFFGSRQGQIFLGSLGGIVVLYVLLGWWEDRRRYLESMAETMDALRVESDELRHALQRDDRLHPSEPVTEEVWPGPPGTSTSSRQWTVEALVGNGPATHQSARVIEHMATTRIAAGVRVLEELSSDVRWVTEQVRESTVLIRELVDAVSEYGRHLQAHTAVMKHLASTTDELRSAASALASAMSSRDERLSPDPPTTERFLRSTADAVSGSVPGGDLEQVSSARLRSEPRPGVRAGAIAKIDLPPVWEVIPLPPR